MNDRRNLVHFLLDNMIWILLIVVVVIFFASNQSVSDRQ